MRASAYRSLPETPGSRRGTVRVRIVDLVYQIIRSDEWQGVLQQRDGGLGTGAWLEVLCLIEPAKPNQNAYIESFNGRIRDERWHWEYSEKRPKKTLGELHPLPYVTDYDGKMRPKRMFRTKPFIIVVCVGDAFACFNAFSMSWQTKDPSLSKS